MNELQTMYSLFKTHSNLNNFIELLNKSQIKPLYILVFKMIKKIKIYFNVMCLL